MSLVARALEAARVATVVVGSARDIVEHCGVPRFLFTDFPLGNPCGRPWDEASQRDIADRAFDLVEQARGPRTTVVTPQVWSVSSAWKEAYMQVGEHNRAALLAAGEARRAQQAAGKQGVAE
ncbi:MAG: hypothetical protein AB7P42_08840 [Gammaproteobacteria bacterium]